MTSASSAPFAADHRSQRTIPCRPCRSHCAPDGGDRPGAPDGAPAGGRGPAAGGVDNCSHRWRPLLSALAFTCADAADAMTRDVDGWTGTPVRFPPPPSPRACWWRFTPSAGLRCLTR